MICSAFKYALLAFAVAFLFREFQDYHAVRSGGFDRRDAKGEFVRLPQGETHYVLREGAGRSAPLVVMIHGMFTGWHSFTPEIDALAAKGYRVLAADAWCRGWSDCPESADSLTAAQYVSQIVLLISRLDLLDRGERATFMGLSMGGAVLANLAVWHPNIVQGLVFLAPAGVIKDTIEPIALLKHMPGFSLVLEMAMPWLAPSFARRAWAPEADLTTAPDAASGGDAGLAEARRLYGSTFGRMHKETVHFGRMTANTLRHFDFNHQHAVFGELGRQCADAGGSGGGHRPPILVIWGKADQVLPFENSARVMELLAPCQPELVPVEGAGHGIVFTRSRIIVEKLLHFLPPV